MHFVSERLLSLQGFTSGWPFRSKKLFAYHVESGNLSSRRFFSFRFVELRFRAQQPFSALPQRFYPRLERLPEPAQCSRALLSNPTGSIILRYCVRCWTRVSFAMFLDCLRACPLYCSVRIRAPELFSWLSSAATMQRFRRSGHCVDGDRANRFEIKGLVAIHSPHAPGDHHGPNRASTSLNPPLPHCALQASRHEALLRERRPRLGFPLSQAFSQRRPAR